MIEVVQMYQLDLIMVLFFQGSEGVQGSQNCLYFNFPPISVQGGGAAPLNEYMADKKYFIGRALCQQYHNHTLGSLHQSRGGGAGALILQAICLLVYSLVIYLFTLAFRIN